MNKFCLIFSFSTSLLGAYAQDGTFIQEFMEASTLMEESQYKTALPIWLKLQEADPSNANLNYKVGICYISSARNKKKSLAYFNRALTNTSKNYDPFSASEKKAPLATYYYLAKAYHYNYELDKATTYYQSFKDNTTSKHYLFKPANLAIEQCENAKIAIANSVKSEIKNMGATINSPYGDYSPVISIDESSIYFTSRRVRADNSNIQFVDYKDGNHFEDIYVSHKYDSVWSKPELLNINTDGHEAIVNISTDGQTIFIFRDDDGDGNIYTSTKNGEIWSEPKKIGSDVNLASKETHAHITPNGNSLYFVSDRDGGKGGKDIYMCKKLPDGEWAKAQNAGDVINTLYDEAGVFIHPDGKTMYFSSNGINSIGDFDIFYSTMDDKENWTKPINMGYPVNSTDDDVFFVTSTDGKRGYFSSFKEEGFGEKDIYQIELKEAEEKRLTLLKGYMAVIGMKELPNDAKVIVTTVNSNEKPKIYKPRKRDGKFCAILESGKDYHITYSTLKHSKEEDLHIPATISYQEINRAIILEDVVFGESTSPIISEFNKEYSFSKNFEYNKYKIDIKDQGYLKLIASILEKYKKKKQLVIEIKSSASKVPTKLFSSNDALAYKRGINARKHIKRELISKGINSNYILFKKVDSSVNGPEYGNGKSKSAQVYKKYQYVTITIK